jgi:hypothetical protein
MVSSDILHINIFGDRLFNTVLYDSSLPLGLLVTTSFTHIST